MGADRLNLLRIYRAIIRPKLDYGCQVYSSAKLNILDPLNSIHHSALRFCTGAFRSSLVQSLYVDAGEMSLQDHRSQLSLQLYTRLHRLQDSPAFKAGCAPNIQRQHYDNNIVLIPFHIRIELLKEKLKLPEFNIIPHSTHNEPPWKYSSETCSSICNLKKTTTSTLSLRIHFLDHIYSEHSDSIHIYTDGSKTNNSVRYSIVMHHTTI